MKKLIKLSGLFSIVMIAFLLMFSTGCKKPTGTLILDNYTTYSFNVDFKGTNCYVGSLGYSSTEVESGSGTATAYTTSGVFWGSISTSVPENGSKTLYLYWDKKSGEIVTSNKDPNIEKQSN